MENKATMEAYPHAIQVLQEKYAQLNSLILERCKIDTTICMVQKDISNCVSSSSAYVADQAPAQGQSASGAPHVQGTQGGNTSPVQGSAVTSAAPVETPTEAPKAQEQAPAPTTTPTPEPTPAPGQTAPAQTTGEVTMEALREKLADLQKKGKGNEAFNIVQSITANPMNATAEERAKIMEAFNALG